MSVITTVSGKIKDDGHVDMRYAPSGTAVLKLRFSKNVGTKDKPEFNNFSAVMFGAQAESLGKLIKAGTEFRVTGRQKVSTYEKRDGGGIGVSIELVVVDFEFAGSAPAQSEQKSEEEPSF